MTKNKHNFLHWSFIQVVFVFILFLYSIHEIIYNFCSLAILYCLVVVAVVVVGAGGLLVVTVVVAVVGL